MGLWCGIKLAPGSLCEKRSCPVFPVIWPSNYPDQGQQPRLKPYSCLEVELCTRGTEDSHALFLFPRSAPSPQSTRELAKAPFPGRWVVRARFHAQAQLSPLLCRARGKTAAARDNRERGETDSVLALRMLGCRSKAGKLTAMNGAGPWITACPGWTDSKPVSRCSAL